MVACSQSELEHEVRRIYKEAIDCYLADVDDAKSGMSVLYTPPMLRPKLMVVSMQGGGADGKCQPTWPKRNVYAAVHDGEIEAVGNHNFGDQMTTDFDEAGMGSMFRCKTVITNLAFAQAKEFGEFSGTQRGKKWLKRSREWLDQLICLMEPRVMLTFGKEPFEKLTGKPKHGGKLAEATHRGVPVVGCGHYSHGWADRPETRGGVVQPQRCWMVARIRELTLEV